MMAWAVRAAQLSQTRLMLILLSITILCGFTFMGVKYVEYKSKWEHGLLWGTNFDYNYVLHGGEHHGAGEDAISIRSIQRRNPCSCRRAAIAAGFGRESLSNRSFNRSAAMNTSQPPLLMNALPFPKRQWVPSG